MGSWNETCMLTGLPIMEGQKCSVVFLLESPYGDSRCYASNAYTPVFVVDGIYDGYGALQGSLALDRYILMMGRAFGIEGDVDRGWFWRLMKDGAVIGAKGITPEAKKELRLRTVFLMDSVRRFSEDILEPGDRERRLEHVAKLQSCSGCLTEGSEDGSWSWHDAMQDFMHDISATPNGTAREIVESCMRTDPVAMGEAASRLCLLTGMLEDLRMAWHIPSGTGDQEGLTKAHRMFARFYQDNIRSIDGWMDC